MRTPGSFPVVAPTPGTMTPCRSPSVVRSSWPSRSACSSRRRCGPPNPPPALPPGWIDTLRQAHPEPEALAGSRIFAASEVPWQEVAPGLRRQVVFSDRLTLVRFHLDGKAAKQHVLDHWHPHDQITHVLAGTVEVVVGNEVRTIGAGGFYVCEANVPHSARVLGDEAELLEVFTPPREDFRGGPPLAAMRREVGSRPLGPNEVRALVYAWFAALDDGAPVETFLPMLAPSGLHMQLARAELHDRADFRRWYVSMLGRVEDVEHEIVDLEVRTADRVAFVTAGIRWTAKLKAGGTRRLDLHEEWIVARSRASDRAVIRSYRVTVQ